MGVLYILDEPSIGLHQRDNAKLIATLTRLRDLGNTVLVVEHDEETIRTADWVIDIGPGAGRARRRDHRQRPARGAPRRAALDHRRLPARRARRSPIPARRRHGNGKALVVRGAREHNLQDIDVRVPAGHVHRGDRRLGLRQEHARRRDPVPGPRPRANGLARDRSARTTPSRASSTSTRSSRSTRARSAARRARTRPPTRACSGRSGSCSPARPEARVRGYKPGRFSFNVKGGRCENCKGDGIIKIEMQFLPDVYVPCEVCKGKRYNREALEIHYKGRSIADVLEMTVEEALEFFARGAERAAQAPDAVRRGPRLRPPRPAGDDAVGRRGAAGQARDRAVAAGDRQDALPARRADDRPPLRRRREAAPGPPPARRQRQHGPRHRAQPRRHQDRRLDRRPRARGRRPRRPGHRRGHAGAGRRDRRARRPASTSPASCAASRSCRSATSRSPTRPGGRAPAATAATPRRRRSPPSRKRVAAARSAGERAARPRR